MTTTQGEDSTPNPFDLHGKVALVTGASSGIGAEIARALGAAGAQVALVGRSRERLAEAVGAVEATGATAAGIVADVCADPAPDEIVAETIDRFGRLDVLVHSAGIYVQASLADTSDEIFDSQWMTNTRAPFRLTRAALPHLGSGSSIVFISSMSGHVGSPNDSAYCASKGAIELIVRALATELAPRGIRVNAVAPGNVRTPMNEGILAEPDVEREILAATPAGRVGVVGDIAPAVVYLASDASAWTHGASLVIDGGMVAM
jgi:NAD(P)-dependent dehydrogenase (short-subunit alcohol dehydrogenase family)